jgi:CubicO group peptidase (beta-lactamase class C family)
MMPLRSLGLVAMAASLLIAPATLLAQSPTTPTRPEARDLAGLWEARLRFGPDVGGPLLVERVSSSTWRAEIAGRRADVLLAGDTLFFELPGGLGGFRGRFQAGRKSIFGHWIQHDTRFASPVSLTRMGTAERWRGEVDPLPDEMTMYLEVEPRADGAMGAFLKNPERNAGFFMRIATLERNGRSVRLLSAPRNGKPAEVLSEGVFADDVLSLPLRGGTYDFRRVPADAASDFYPRSRPGVGAAYRYEAPPALDDGWPVATPEAVGLSREALERFVRMIIDTPIDSVSCPDIHGVLIARHGKLVLEEYFHGFHRDKPHGTRSATKSLGSVLVGAAIEAGVPLSPESPVYQVMNGGTFPQGLDPRKQRLTLAHLLTMSSGLDADDSNDDSVGNEDRVQEGDNPDWWKFTSDLAMLREPGEKAVYASLQANLVGAVLRKASGRPLLDLYHDLVLEPLQIRRYWLGLQPLGEPYGGGGSRLLPRDFMKLGQLILNGGTWNGRRIVSAEWARTSTAFHMPIGRSSKYGYLWWVYEYPFQGRTIQAFYAAGNGGQVVMGIPELDLVFTAIGGNYSDNPVIFRIQRNLVPEYVLPAMASAKQER